MGRKPITFPLITPLTGRKDNDMLSPETISLLTELQPWMHKHTEEATRPVSKVNGSWLIVPHVYDPFNSGRCLRGWLGVELFNRVAQNNGNDFYYDLLYALKWMIKQEDKL